MLAKMHVLTFLKHFANNSQTFTVYNTDILKKTEE